MRFKIIIALLGLCLAFHYSCGGGDDLTAGNSGANTNSTSNGSTGNNGATNTGPNLQPQPDPKPDPGPILEPTPEPSPDPIPEPGPEPEPVSGQLNDIGVVHSGGGSGVYYLPAGFDSGRKYPLVVLLHGLSYENTWMGKWMVSEFTSLADEHGIILLGLDGFLRENPLGDGQLYYFNPNHVNVPPEDYTFIMNAVSKILGSYLIDEAHVMIAGMSMGVPASMFVGTKSSVFTHVGLMHGVRWNYDEGGKNDVPNVLIFSWEETPIGTNHPPFWYSTSIDDPVTNYSMLPFAMSVDTDLNYLLGKGLSVTKKFCYTGGHTMGSTEKQEMINWFLLGTTPGACP